MGYETPNLIPEQSIIVNGKFETLQSKQQYLEQERKNHVDITPAFRTLGEIAKKLPAGFKFNKINGAKFNLPIINLDEISYETRVQEDNVFVFGYIEDYGKDAKVFEATFFKDDNLQERISSEQVNYRETVSEGEEMRKVLPQEGDLVMIDKICCLDESGVVASRKVNDLDCEGDGKFNKFRLIEMIGQAGSYSLLSDINTGGEEKKIAAYKDMNVKFYPAADEIVKDDDLIITIKMSKGDENMEQKRAHGEIRKMDGKIVFESDFSAFKPKKTSFFRKMVGKIAQKLKK